MNSAQLSRSYSLFRWPLWTGAKQPCLAVPAPPCARGLVFKVHGTVLGGTPLHGFW